MATDQKLLTVEEFGNLPQPPDGSLQELVRGEIITMPWTRSRHRKVQLRVGVILDHHIRPRKLGQVFTETGVITERDPDSVRGADVAYWSTQRLPFGEEPETYPETAADLCVEVQSPGESARYIRDKVRE